MTDWQRYMARLFPYFGCKRKVTDRIWDALGDVDHYIEPFCGSAAVLFQRPSNHSRKGETINDADGYITNLWRSIRYHPERVAAASMLPCDQLTQEAVCKELIIKRDSLTSKLRNDSKWCDPEVAGEWLWGACLWIGSGWAYRSSTQIPKLTGYGQGVKSLTLRDDVEGLLEAISERLKHVRILCSDWKVPLADSIVVKSSFRHTGIFLDPPYDMSTGRGGNLYSQEMDDTSTVKDWCLEYGKKEDIRIVITGYDGEYRELEENGWEVEDWSADGGYKNQSKTEDNDNRHKERIWYSPQAYKLKEGEVNMGGFSSFMSEE